MENASKALIMAAGVLIGILILSLAVFLFVDFGATSKGIYTQVESNQLTQYNAQYTVYSGRNDITVYEIVSVINLAKQNNKDYGEYSNFEDDYQVLVYVGNTNYTNENPKEIEEFLKENSEVINNNDSETIELKKKYKCDRIDYHNNGKVSLIQFKPTS